jgi:protein subunit release factor B
MVTQKKREDLQERMTKLGILDDDLIEKFILGSGSGGQKINKTNSCVYLKHSPSEIEVKCQRSRSQDMNRKPPSLD